jgi:hypothetical protein
MERTPTSPALLVPDALLPSQYVDRIGRRWGADPERRLLLAILEDAVEVYLKHAAAVGPRHRRLFADAERWVEDTDRSRLCAFETVCEVLGLDAASLRRGLRAHKARARGTIAWDAGFAAEPARRRASNE